MYERLNLDNLHPLPTCDYQKLINISEVAAIPYSLPDKVHPATYALVVQCANSIREAKNNGASVILFHGAHLIKNGGVLLLKDLIRDRFLTHIATNGASSVHDWEFAAYGGTSEDVRANIANGTFGMRAYTCMEIMKALSEGVDKLQGYGEALGAFICSDRQKYAHKKYSVFAEAFRTETPLTVHPGIGYDVLSNSSFYNGALVGDTAATDFRVLCHSLYNATGGVILSIGSAVMGPQVCEKAVSCVNNIRLNRGKSVLKDFSIYVVDIQDGGNWDWQQNEPPKSHPAYYLRFCKSYSRIGGAMQYVQCDNIAFLQLLYCELLRS